MSLWETYIIGIVLNFCKVSCLPNRNAFSKRMNIIAFGKNIPDETHKQAARSLLLWQLVLNDKNPLHFWLMKGTGILRIMYQRVSLLLRFLERNYNCNLIIIIETFLSFLIL